jgi:hypothetical protein
MGTRGTSKEKHYAVDSFGGCLGRRWGDSMGDKQLHTDAGHHEEDPQCRRIIAGSSGY